MDRYIPSKSPQLHRVAGLALGIRILHLPWCVVAVTLAGVEQEYMREAARLSADFLEQFRQHFPTGVENKPPRHDVQAALDSLSLLKEKLKREEHGGVSPSVKRQNRRERVELGV